MISTVRICTIQLKVKLKKEKLLKFRQGFTLMELMIVVAIIIILVAIAVPSFKSIEFKAKKAKLADEDRKLSQALEMYKVDWGGYPIESTGVQLGDTSSDFYKEMTGDGSLNNPSNVTATGEQGGIDYFGDVGLRKIVNPFAPNAVIWGGTHSAHQYDYGTTVPDKYVIICYTGHTGYFQLLRNDSGSVVIKTDEFYIVKTDSSTSLFIVPAGDTVETDPYVHSYNGRYYWDSMYFIPSD